MKKLVCLGLCLILRGCTSTPVDKMMQNEK